MRKYEIEITEHAFSSLILIFNQSVDKKSAQKPYMRAFA